MPGLRAGIAIGTPIIVAAIIGEIDFGTFVSVGALLMVFADHGGTYLMRARALLTALVLCLVAMSIGTPIAANPFLAAPALGLWGFLMCGFMLFSYAYGGIGFVATIAFLGAVGFGPVDSIGEAIALRVGAIAMGGAWALVLILFLWPVRRYEPALKDQSRRGRTF